MVYCKQNKEVPHGTTNKTKKEAETATEARAKANFDDGCAIAEGKTCRKAGDE